MTVSIVNLSSQEATTGAAPDPFVIGLVNNMPDAALHTTERQFRELIGAAASRHSVSLRFFALPGVPRGEAGRLYVSQRYEEVSALREHPVDGLIVTGTEPRAPNLPDEPYWRALTDLVDWAERSKVSTVWSCLAAHAAVLHLDGIDRQRLPAKLSGVFECAKTQDHPIVSGLPSRWCVPHSRYNGLPEEALAAKGYGILARSHEAGVDTFVRDGGSLFIFLQGHPEYDRGALFREYRRDVGRFLAGERDHYPAAPRCYFDATTAAVFANFEQQALSDRRVELLPRFPVADGESGLSNDWCGPAVSLYANWLAYLAASKSV